jgi:metal-responsive CopG/Arc/MetJ family transcriptional regulator
MTDKKEGTDSEERRKIRESVLARLDAPEIDPKRQRVAVMARLQVDIVEFLDALVKLKIYSSRSDAVAGIIRKEILAEPEVYEQIRLQAEKIDEMESTTQELAQKVRKE